MPVATPCTENFSDSSSSAIDAMSTSVMSVEVDGDMAVSPISLRRFATYLCELGAGAKRERKMLVSIYIYIYGVSHMGNRFYCAFK